MEIEENSNEKVQIVVVGNKKDLVDSGPVFSEKLVKFKKYLTSAKTGYNVAKLFSELTASVLSKIQKGQIRTDGTYGVKKGNISKGTKLRSTPEQDPRL